MNITKILCITCAFKTNIENNPHILVMSKESDKKVSICHNCEKKVGHSKDLDKLVGIYHRARHEHLNGIRRQLKNGSLEIRFKLFRENHLNGDTLNCFLSAIKYQNYKERTIRDSFNKLVTPEDYEMFHKKTLLEEIMEITVLKKEMA